MDHAEALERMEIAAAEPDGLDRLMAGDTPDAAAVAGHLAGCGTCPAELARLRRVAGIARSVVAEMPDPALRERTLAYVRANSKDRSGVDADLSIAALQAPSDADADPSIAALQVPSDADAESPAALVVPAALETPAAAEAWEPEARIAGRGWRRPWPITRVAGIAAALALVGVIGYGIGGGFTQEAPHDDRATAVLAAAASKALDLAAQPDTQVVALTATPAGGGATGRLAFSGASGELVMVATGLGAPGDGAEYGCWVEADGERRRLGTMYPAGDGTWAWSGAAAGLDVLPAGTVFGVSLVPADGTGVPVVTGGL